MMKTTATIGATISALVSTSTMAQKQCVVDDFKTLVAPVTKFTEKNSETLNKCRADLGDVSSPIEEAISMLESLDDVSDALQAQLMSLVTQNTDAFCDSQYCQKSLSAFSAALKGQAIPDCTINGVINPSTVISLVQSTCKGTETAAPGYTAKGDANPTLAPTGGYVAPTPQPSTNVPIKEARTCQATDFIDLISTGEKFLEDNSAILDSCQADLGDIADPIDTITKVKIVDGKIIVPSEVVEKLAGFVTSNTEAFCASVSCQGALKALDTAVKGLKIPDCTLNGLVNPSTIMGQVQDICNIGTNLNLGTSEYSAKSGATSVQKASFILSAVAVISFALMM